ncbi:integrase core domain-containing protein [Streptococcus pneumoniae]|nr:integrase core domain-containing protein [Streptococcus pneumoniae]
MTEFSLDLLLKAIKLARWTYYYHLKQLDKTDKDQELKAEIQSIFIEHKGNYAYRRVHLELRNRAYLVNHKRVQGLIKVLNLQAKMRQKRKYSSHKGDVGLSNKFGINNSNLRYMIKLIDRYGIEFVKKGKNRYYSPDLKQEMIHKV